MDKKTSNSIYAIRGVGAILIMVYHYSVHYSNCITPLRFNFFDFAYLTFAVPLFFLLSAYFLYGKAIKICNPIKLIIYRLTRLYPMYWIAVIFSSVILVFIGHENLSLKRIALNMTMIEKVFGVEHIDGAYWTMFYELMLLLILSIFSILILRNKKTKKRTQAFCIVWLVIGAVSSAFLKFFNIDSSSIAVLMFACRYVPVFVMGVLFYNRYCHNNEKINDRSFIVIYVCSIVYELVLGQNLYHGIYGIIAIIIGHAVLSGRLSNSIIFNSKPLVFLGKISYNIYLIHNQFGRVMIGKIAGIQNNTILVILFIVLIGCLSVALAYFFSLIEKKLVKKLEKLSDSIVSKIFSEENI